MISKRSLHFFWASVFALVWMGACGKSDRSDGGDTHWLGACERDSQCQSGTCLCGICTEGCVGDRGCEQSGSACFETSSPGVATRCGGRTLPTEKGICLGLCRSDDNCAPGLECLLGACVPAQEGAAKDGGGPSPGKEAGAPSVRIPSRLPADGGLPSANAYADVNVPADFTEPTVVPPPSTTITGDGSPFAGSWVVQTTFSKRACVPGDTEVTCAHLDVHVDKSGRYGVTYLKAPAPVVDARVLQGPFPAATDPSVGYPAGATGEQLGIAELNLLAGVTYDGLDGVAESDGIDFSLSAIALWNDWCSLQTPYEWDLGGDHRYRCVPRTADDTTTDLAKLTLCISATDGPLCGHDDHALDSPACIGYASVCSCTATACRTNLRAALFRMRLVRSGDTLVGNLTDGFTNSALTFVKEGS